MTKDRNKIYKETPCQDQKRRDINVNDDEKYSINEGMEERRIDKMQAPFNWPDAPDNSNRSSKTRK